MSREPLGRATLAKESFLQDVLNVPPAVQHAMHRDGRGFEGIDDAVGFVMQFPEFHHPNLGEFRGDVPMLRKFPELQARSSEACEQSVCSFHRIVHRNERIDVEEVVLGILVEYHIILFHA